MISGLHIKAINFLFSPFTLATKLLVALLAPILSIMSLVVCVGNPPENSEEENRIRRSNISPESHSFLSDE